MIGGFYSCYQIGTSFDCVFDTGYGGITNYYVNIKGGHVDPTSTAEIVIDHSEGDLACTVALWWYMVTKRTPASLDPDINFPSTSTPMDYWAEGSGGEYWYGRLDGNGYGKMGVTSNLGQSAQVKILHAYDTTMEKTYTANNYELMSVVSYDINGWHLIGNNAFKVYHRIYSGSSCDPEDEIYSQAIVIHQGFMGRINTVNVTYSSPDVTLSEDSTYTFQLEILAEASSADSIYAGYNELEELDGFVKIWAFGLARYNQTLPSGTFYEVTFDTTPNDAIPLWRPETGIYFWFNCAGNSSGYKTTPTLSTDCMVIMGEGTYDFKFAKSGYYVKYVWNREIDEDETVYATLTQIP